jgi:hypothetical protein
MASTHAEMGELPCRRVPTRLDLRDMGGLRPAIEKRKEAFERIALPFGDDFNRAIGLITHPAHQAEIDGAVLGRVTEADALYSSVHNRVKLML